MHGSIRDRLENLLTQGTSIEDVTAREHLRSCAECSNEIEQMRTQNQLFRELRPPSVDLEPEPGFYARVLQRIEEQRPTSIWAALLSSPMSRRLAYGSLTLALVFGSYVVAHEERDGHFRNWQTTAQLGHDDAVFGSPSEQRDAVLANFVSR
jgi:hypothetical protein